MLTVVKLSKIFSLSAGNKTNRAEKIRTIIEKMGPIYIKFGQLLSTRRDLLSEDIADELAKLQDSVAPFDFEIADKILKNYYKDKLEDIFSEIDNKPLASASISQVHAAKLRSNNKEVVIKILRPNIHKKIKKNIKLIKTFSFLLELFFRKTRQLKLREIASEYERIIFDELDLLQDGANASLLKRNFPDKKMLYVPKVYFEYSCEHILVMEKIYGIQVSDVNTMRARGVNLEKLSKLGVEIFFTQVFRDCFFHADMHPGNVYVDISDPANPHYIALDFGIFGSLAPNDQRYLALNLLAFFNRDYRKIAKLHIESGWVNKNTRIDVFEGAIRTIAEPIFAMPLSQISFGKLLMKLLKVCRKHGMEIQPQLFLLQKTLVSVEGLGRQLYPDLDLWETALPFLEKWIKGQLGLKAAAKRVYNEFPETSREILELPGMLYKFLARKVD